VVFVYMALMGTRFLWLWLMRRLSNARLKRPFIFANYSTRDLAVSTFAGVRGAITLAGVLSIPVMIEGRYELIFIATGVILFSLICASFILPVLLSGKVILDNNENDREAMYAKGLMAEEAIASLEKMQENLQANTAQKLDSEIVKEVSSRVIGSLRRRTGLKNQEEKSLEAENLERRLRLVAIGAERSALYQMKAKKEISDETFERLNYDLVLYEAMLAEDN
jgi:monovalent cation/hydrogen antiporter